LVSGTWTYTLDQSATQSLDAGDSVTDTITYTASDGTTQVVTVTITGSEDAAIISGTASAAAIEDDAGSINGSSQLALAGTLSAIDADAGESGFVAGVGVHASTVVKGVPTGQLGNFSINGAGAWTWTLANGTDGTASDVQDLAAGETLVETYTVTTLGGDTQAVTLTITGTNDVPVISVQGGDSASGAVGETANAFAGGAGATDGTGLAASGTLTLTDIDVSNTASVAVTNVVVNGALSTADAGDQAAIGNATLAAMMGLPSGSLLTSATQTSTFSWSFNSGAEAFDHLSAGKTLVLDYTIEGTSSDGASDTQLVRVTITGSNDGALISGTATAALTEDDAGATVGANLVTGGTLTVSDLDTGEAVFQGATLAGSNVGLGGQFVIQSNGQWSYQVPATSGPLQALAAGQTITDTASVATADGTTQTLTIVLTGVDDAAIIGGTSTAGVTDGNPGDISGGLLTAGGTLTIIDPDNGQAGFVPQAISTGNNPALGGSLVIDGTGNWTWTAPDGQAVVKALSIGETISETFTVTSVGGDTHPVTITITGANDDPVFSIEPGDNAAGAMTEGGFGVPLSSAGQVTLTDVDVSDSLDVGVALTGVSGNAGPLSNAELLAMFTAGGTDVVSAGSTSSSVPWSFDSSGAASPAKIGFDHLGAGEILTLTYTLTATDGQGQTAIQPITITITGTDDAPVVSGDVSGAVREDMGAVGNLISAAGTLTITDADIGQGQFQAATITAAHGSFTIDTAGNWTYSADTTQSAIAALAEGETITDSANVLAVDGMPQLLTVTITGSNDQPQISNGSGDADGASLAELAAHTGDTPAGTLQASGTLTVLDVDLTDNVSVTVQPPVSVTGATGSISAADLAAMLTVNPSVIGPAATSGTLNWSFDSDLSGSSGIAHAFDHLPDGDTLTLVYTVVVSDDSSATAGANAGATEGTSDSHQITITITGTNDLPIVIGDLTGTANATANSTAPLTTSGNAIITDPDGGQGVFTGASVTGTYGTLTIQPAGNWSFSAAGNQAAIQGLLAGQTVTDTFTVTGTDGTPATITITLGGADDVAVVTGDTTGAMTEDAGVVGGQITASGGLQAVDLDVGQSGFIAATHSGAYGSLQLDVAGNWTYSATNDAPVIQQLAAGQTITDIITVQTIGGDEVAVAITITGVNDAPSIVAQLPDLVFADGDSPAVSMAGRFVDVDQGADMITYSAAGLPPGLAIDPATGNISGQLPANASDLGPYTVTITAADEFGAMVDMTVNINVTNPAPIEVFALQDEAVMANTSLNLDVGQAFSDGGNDSDVLSFTATGLPTGLALDPATGMVSGIIDHRANEGGPSGDGRWVVTIRAVDASGAMVESTLVFQVFDGPPPPGMQTPLPSHGAGSSSAGNGPGGASGGGSGISSNLVINGATNELSDLGGTDDLRTERLVILDAVDKLDGLGNATGDLSVGVPIADEIADENRRIEREAQAREALDGGRQNEWQTRSFAGSVLRMDVGHSADANQTSASPNPEIGRSETAGTLRDELRVETLLTDKTVIVEMRAELNQSRSASVESYRAVQPDGRPLPDWIRMTPSGLMIVERPAALEVLEVKIVATLTNGETIERTVTIEVNTGEVAMQDSDEPASPASALFSDQLRGTDDGSDQRDQNARLAEALAKLQSGP
ncbi:MAG: VCBS domain-containing protein, partial [Pseudomonadota bacterium]